MVLTMINEIEMNSGKVVASRLIGHEAKIQGNRTRTLAITVKVREDSISLTAILDPGIYVKVGNNGTGSGSVLEKHSMAHGRKTKSGLSSLRTCLKTNELVDGRSNHLNLTVMNLVSEGAISWQEAYSALAEQMEEGACVACQSGDRAGAWNHRYYTTPGRYAR